MADSSDAIEDNKSYLMKKIHDFKDSILKIVTDENTIENIKKKFDNITFAEVAFFLFMLSLDDDEQNIQINEFMAKYNICESHKPTIKNHYLDFAEIKKVLLN